MATGASKADPTSFANKVVFGADLGRPSEVVVLPSDVAAVQERSSPSAHVLGAGE